MNYTTSEKIMSIVYLNEYAATELSKEIEHHKEIALKMKELKDHITDDHETFKKACFLMGELNRSEVRIKTLQHIKELCFELAKTFDS